MKTVDVNTTFIREAKHARDTHQYFNHKLQFQHWVNFPGIHKAKFTWKGK